MRHTVASILAIPLPENFGLTVMITNSATLLTFGSSKILNFDSTTPKTLRKSTTWRKKMLIILHNYDMEASVSK